MTKRIPVLMLALLFTALASSSLLAQKHVTEATIEQGHDEDHFDRVLSWYKQWTNPANEDDIDAKLYLGYKQWLTMDNSVAMKATASSSWVQAGKSQDGNVSGRATSIAFEDTTNQVIYLATSQGGVWKSVDAGLNWVPLSESWATLNMGGIALDPKNKQVVYAGTGDPYGSSGIGVYKSTNGGLDWALVGNPGSVTNMMAVSPDSDLVYHAGTRGVSLSTDGGVTWTAVCPIGSGAASDACTLVIDPENPAILFAAARGTVRRSTDHGRTWTVVYTYSGASTMSVGISDHSSAQNQKRVYVSASISGKAVIAVSKDTGTTWEVASTNNGTTGPNYLWIQGWYANALGVNPYNSQDVIVGGLDIYRSQSGGTYLDQKTVWTNPNSVSNFTHADIHFLIYSGSKLFALTDGGIFSSVTGGDTWKQTMNRNLSTFQFVGGDADPNLTYFAAGAQDNGVNKVTKTGSFFHSIMGGDGGTTYIGQDDGRTIYSTYLGAVLYRSPDAGSSWARSSTGTNNLLDPSDIQNEAPGGYMEYDVCEQDPGVVAVCGTKRVFLTVDGGNDQFPAVTSTTGSSYIVGGPRCVHIAKIDPSRIYVGGSSYVYFSPDQGATWTRSTTKVTNATDITTDPNDPMKVYASLGGTNSVHFMSSTDGGVTWDHPATNLPNVNYKRIEVAADGQIFMGHDYGVVRSQDGGATWYPVKEGLPMAQITSLHVRGGYLVAATYGRGMFYIDLSGLPPIQAGVVAQKNGTASSLAIDGLYPNPATTNTISVSYSNTVEGRVSVAVYDVLGREEMLLSNEWMNAGKREAHFNIQGLSVGKHFMVLTANGQTVTQPFNVE